MAVRINSAYDAARYYASRTTKSTSAKSTSNAAKSSSSAKSSAAANASRYVKTSSKNASSATNNRKSASAVANAAAAVKSTKNNNAKTNVSVASSVVNIAKTVKSTVSKAVKTVTGKATANTTKSTTKTNVVSTTANNVSAKKSSASAKSTATATYTSLGKTSKTTKTSNTSKSSSNVAANMAKAVVSTSKKTTTLTSALNNAVKAMVASTTRASNSGTTVTTPKNTSAKMTANTKSEKLSLYGMIAKKAGVPTNGNGEPYITNKTDSDKYFKALNEYNKSNNKAAYLAGVNTSATGEPRINSAAEAKAYQEALKIYSEHQQKSFSINAYNKIKSEYISGSNWDGADKYTSKNGWTSQGCAAFASKVFEETWNVPLDVAFDIDNKSGDDGGWYGDTSIYGLNTTDGIRYAKKELTLENVTEFINQLEPGTCLATDYSTNHTLMVTEINKHNSTLTVYEGNVNSGHVSLKEYSYEEFINNYDDNHDNTIKIYTCVSGNQRLDKNGNIVKNNYPALYGY